MKRVLLFFIVTILSVSALMSLASCNDTTDDGICNIGDIQQGGCD